MKLSHRYINRLCKFYFNDHTEEYGIISQFFPTKYGNQFFLIRISNIQDMEKEVGADSAFINFDTFKDELIFKYFRKISETEIVLAKNLHEPPSFDKLLGGQSEASEKVDLALFEIELKYLEFFKSRKTDDPFEEHDRLYLHRTIYTNPPNISLQIDDEIPEYIKNECQQAFKELFKPFN